MCEPDVVYFGREVPPGKTVHLTPTDAADDDDDDGVSLVHATQVALGPTPAPGRHTVFAVHDGVKVPVGTLQVGVCEQFSVDLMWSALAGAPHAGAVAFAHSGASSVFVSGYKTVTSLLDDASDGGEPASDEFGSEESEEEESEEEEAGGGRRAVKVSVECVCGLWACGGRGGGAHTKGAPRMRAGRRFRFPLSLLLRPTAACATSATCRPRAMTMKTTLR